LDRSIEHQKSASQHRLNQPSAKQNANLQAATAKKEALSALKRQSRAETISVVSTLNAYPLKGALKKVRFFFLDHPLFSQIQISSTSRSQHRNDGLVKLMPKSYS
jgi:hypothetical protein